MANNVDATKNDNSTYSWINFKIDKKLHTKFSMILKYGNKRIREVMTTLVQQYVNDNHESIIDLIHSPTTQSKEEEVN